MAEINTSNIFKTVPKFDGSSFIEWTIYFNDILQITLPF